MVTQALAAVGVEAVVEGLGKFAQGFGEINNWIDKFSLKGAKLSKIFEPINRGLGMFFESLRRIGEFVVAGLILKGIEKITTAIRNMAAELVNAAIEFQGLQIRLENFIAADLVASGQVENMADALQMAVEPAEELFNWIQKIAIATPFDSQDVANAFTMAKAWGFNTDEAQKLTQQVIDFTAGMGLGGEAMDRVIKALGQMKSLGRVAGQELLQLANAGVPVADIMDAIRNELGLTTDEFEKLRREGGVSADMFFAKWEELVSTRFLGSADRMSRTLSGVLSNVKDLINGMVGFNVVKPVLDAVSGRLADILGALTQGGRFESLRTALEGVGTALSTVVEALFAKFLPGDADAIADKFVEFLAKISLGITQVAEAFTKLIFGNISFTDFIENIVTVFGGNEEQVNKALGIWDTIQNIIQKVKDIFAAFKEGGLMGGLAEMGVPEPILNFISMIIQALDNIIQFWTENKGEISQIFKEIATGLAETLGITGSLPEGETSLLELVGGLIVGLTEKLIANAPSIVEKLSTIGNIITTRFLPAFREVSTWVLQNQNLVFRFIEAFTIGLITMRTVALAFAAIAGGFAAAFITIVGATVGGWAMIIDTTRNKIREWYQNIQSWYSGLSSAGRNLVAGFFNGIINYFYAKYGYILTLFRWLIDQIKSYLGISSPSKLFEEIGENLMEGLSVGIQKAVELPTNSMKMAVTHMIQPAQNALAGTTNNHTVNNNYNMTVNSQASAEPIIADFRMMQSFAGGG